jgi:hypothetical protein
MGIYISDDMQAGLMFPNKSGEVDVNTLFVSNDPIFCEKCSDISGNIQDQAIEKIRA